ncbi:MAG: hypothetical protein WBO70_01550 [Erysipelotrichaceae bacterium]
MLAKLIKINIINLLNTGQKKSKSMIISSLFQFGIACFIGFSLSIGLYATLGYNEVSLTVLAIYILFLVFMFLYQSSQGYLTGAKDVEMLMGMPITIRKVFVAKLVSFFYLDTLISLGAFGFVVFGYIINTNISILNILYGFIAIIGVIIGVGVLCGVLALAVKKISSKFKFKNLINNLIYILIFLFAMSFQFIIRDQSILNSLSNYFEYSKFIVPNIYFAISAITNNSLIYALLSLGFSGLLFVAFIYLFAKIFVDVNLMPNVEKHSKFVFKKVKKLNSFSSLLGKEMKSTYTNFMYMFNLSLGQFMLIAGAIALVVMKNQVSLFLSLMNNDNMIFFGFIVAVFIGAGMSNLASCSLSLEGENWQTLKTLPINYRELMHAKILTTVILIIVGSTIALGIVGIGYGFSWFEILFSFVSIIVMSFFVGYFGLNVNLLMPHMKYDNEIQVIKQSGSVTTCILVHMAVSMVIGFSFFTVNNLFTFKIFMTLMVLMVILVLLMEALIRFYWTKEIESIE